MSISKLTSLLAVLSCIALLVGCGGGGGGGGTETPTDRVAPVIQNSTVTPPPGFSFPGGKVTITATVTDNVGVATVVARIHNSATGLTTTVQLPNMTGNTYQSKVDIIYDGVEPGEQVFTITVVATDAAGNSKTATAGTLQLVLEAPPPVPL